MYSIKGSDVKKFDSFLPNGEIFGEVSKFRSRNPIKRIVFNRYLKSLMHFTNGVKSIIDIGCGEGIILYLANKFERRQKLVGIDLSDESLRIAKQIVDGDFIKADAHHLPIRDAEFDLSFCLSVFEHIERHEMVVKEVVRVSKNSVITIPHPPLFRLISILSLKNWTRLGRAPNHLKEFKKHELKGILPKNANVKWRNFWLIAEIKGDKKIV